ncbi:MAG TPA: protein kinase [Polyangiaceae bacterium]|nr:protein kinase [Polyangiaceae bacterium]
MSAPVREGDVLAGKYSVERVIGQGGMGVVVAARHIQLGQKVALKFLLPAAFETPEAVARFLREAQAAFQIRSEHVARILDVGTLETGSPFMVMEFLTGSDLGQVLEERGALPISEAIGYVLQACEAIAEAHSLGIVHRDLKPANLFLTRRADGSSLIKVLDFGISKSTATSTGPASSVTATTAVIGSPAYMSPEQVRSSKHVDARTDIWALGVVVYQLVAGALPFGGQTLTELLAMIAADPPMPLRAARRDAPAQLEQLLNRCLEKDPRRRVANVAELALGLAPFAPDARLSVERIVRLIEQAPPGSVTPTAPSAPWSQPQSPAMPVTGNSWAGTRGGIERRRGPAIFVAGATAIALLGAGGVLVFQRLHGAAAASTAAVDQAPPAATDAPHTSAASGTASTTAATPGAAVPGAPVLAPLPSEATPPRVAVDAGHAETPAPASEPAPSRRNVPTTPRRVPNAAPSKAPADDMFNDTK